MSAPAELSEEEVAQIISLFDIPGWKNVDAEKILLSQLGSRFLNRTYKIERLDDETGDGPKSLVVKKYGGNIQPEMVKEFGLSSPVIHSLIAYEQSRRGWGPELYGLFEDGRVEEFVECDTLTAQEAFSPETVKDVAKALARFHSHDLPLKKDTREFLEEMMASVDESKEALREWHSSSGAECLQNFPVEELLNFPFADESEWISSTLKKVKHRTVLCAYDPNYQHRLVRSEDAGDESATRVVIIHYDASCYSFRGSDIAGHFVFRMFDLTKKEDKLTGLSYPDESERSAFYAAYLDESAKVFDDFDPDSLDTMDNLALEVDIGCCAFLLAYLIHYVKSAQLMQMDPALSSMIGPQIALFKEMKDNLFRKYPSLVN